MKKIVVALSLIAGFSVNAFAREAWQDPDVIRDTTMWVYADNLTAHICNKTASQYFNFKFDSSDNAYLDPGQNPQIYLVPGQCEDIKYHMMNKLPEVVPAPTKAWMRFKDLWTTGSGFTIEDFDGHISNQTLPSQYRLTVDNGSWSNGVQIKPLEIKIIDKPRSGFIKLGNGCTEDASSGLIWATNANLPGHSLDWVFSSAQKMVSSMNNTPSAIGYNLCGYKDWRLPTNKELLALVDHAKQVGATKPYTDWFNSHGFSSVGNLKIPLYDIRDGSIKLDEKLRVNSYCSSDKLPKPQGYRDIDRYDYWHCVDMVNGNAISSKDVRGGAFGVWPVRGGQ